MKKRLIPFVLVGAWLIQGCVPVGGGFGDAGTVDESVDGGLGAVVRLDEASHFVDFAGEVFIDAPPLASVWRPRWHPQGTLLRDGSRDLWMTVSSSRRRPVAGDDVLGEVGLDDRNAILMTSEEERCLLPEPDDEYWYPENYAWQPLYGPYEYENLYLVDWEHRTRRIASIEALDSWGYFTPWLDYFDGRLEMWESLALLEEPLRFRDGALVRTDIATYFLLHGRAYIFYPQSLAEEAGYRSEEMLRMTESRLRALALVTTALTRDLFDSCPADETFSD